MQAYILKDSRAYYRAIAALFAGSLVSFAVLYCTQPLLPVFSREFQLSPSWASLSVSLPTGAMALSMLLVAGLSDRIGRKRTMAIALGGASLLTLASAFVNDFNHLLFFRALQGVLLAGFPSIAMAYVNEEFDPSITGLVMGIYVSGTSIGGLAGRLAVSAITDHFSWQLALGSLGLLTLLASLGFWLALPNSQRFQASPKPPRQLALALLRLLQNRVLLSLYAIGFAIMGSFVTLYNYIGYPLLAPPYSLSQTAIGALFFLYLVGTFSSTYMGRQADQLGHSRILCRSLSIMLVGALATLLSPLFLKLTGLAVFTFGFFASHSVVSSWIGKCAAQDKAQASSLYLLFYYLGASVIGGAGGFFLHRWNWPGVIFLAAFVLSLAFAVSFFLLRQEKSAAIQASSPLSVES
ncbi:MFS transporter [Azotosporobacter soli]|uniref:MFS transporter n=1 Tax=Azotosporobacter soli TaxID=3055040 RepID=UPI0031FE5207